MVKTIGIDEKIPELYKNDNKQKKKGNEENS